MELKAVSKYLLKKQKHTSRTPEGWPVQFPSSAYFQCSSQGICSIAPSKNPDSKIQQFLTRTIRAPEKCLETNVWKVSFWLSQRFCSVTGICYLGSRMPNVLQRIATQRRASQKQWTLAHYKLNLRWRISCNTWLGSSRGKGNQNWLVPIPSTKSPTSQDNHKLNIYFMK